MNIFKIMELAKGNNTEVFDRLKDICIRVIDSECNIGRDRAELIVATQFNEIVKYLQEKEIV